MDKKALINEDLDNVAGGGAPWTDSMYDLYNFETKTVTVPAGSLLVMQDRPGGAFMPVSFKDGEQILVNRFYNYSGYLLAYKNGTYGLVDGHYVK